MWMGWGAWIPAEFWHALPNISKGADSGLQGSLQRPGYKQDNWPGGHCGSRSWVMVTWTKCGRASAEQWLGSGYVLKAQHQKYWMDWVCRTGEKGRSQGRFQGSCSGQQKNGFAAYRCVDVYEENWAQGRIVGRIVAAQQGIAGTPNLSRISALLLTLKGRGPCLRTGERPPGSKR